MRPSTLGSHHDLLLRLRAGDVSFEHAARDLRHALEVRARRFSRTWSWSGQTSAQVDVDDLVQEMLLELWRAVDRWDPKRRDRTGKLVTIVRYVDGQIGRAATKRLRHAAGYPDPRRKTQPARRVHVEDIVDVGGAELAVQEDVAALRERAREVVARLDGIDRCVVELVVLGHTLAEAADQIYRDPDLRIAHRMDSEQDARRMVDEAAKRMTRAASARAE